MLTLEQAIADLMDASRSIAEVAESESDEANMINAQNCADDCKQIAEWLKELQKKRKEPKRVKGRWIEISSTNHTYKCSECGRLLVNITDGKNNVSKHYPYCHCGADMKGEPMGEKEHEYIFQIAKDCDGVYCYIKQGELIRCGECARRRTMCDGKDRCTVFNVFVDSDGYCKWAERKADG